MKWFPVDTERLLNIVSTSLNVVWISTISSIVHHVVSTLYQRCWRRPNHDLSRTLIEYYLCAKFHHCSILLSGDMAAGRRVLTGCKYESSMSLKADFHWEFFCSRAENTLLFLYRFLRSRTQKKVEHYSTFFFFPRVFLFCFFIHEQKYSQWKSAFTHSDIVVKVVSQNKLAQSQRPRKFCLDRDLGWGLLKQIKANPLITITLASSFSNSNTLSM